jgi:Phosphoesterase family
MACAWRPGLEPVAGPSVSSDARIRLGQSSCTETTGKSRCYLTAVRGESRLAAQGILALHAPIVSRVSVCSQGQYARKHAPWTNFSNVPGSVSQPFTSWPAGDFAGLPTVSFVIPNLCNDMHDCDVAAGDAWLRAHISAYADWAMSHDSLLILTWDENDDSPGNQITTIMAGQLVKAGRYAEPITHYNVLATIETAYALPRSGQAATAQPITGIWAQ